MAGFAIRSVAFAAALSMAPMPVVAVAQSTPVCGWMSDARLDELLAFGAPWRTDSGGESGSCSFTGTSTDGWLLLSITQTLRGSPSAAAEMAREMRTRMGATYAVQSMPNLGKEAFSWRDESDASRIGLNITGHNRQMVAMGYLSGPRSVADKAQGMSDIMQAALQVAEERTLMKSARQCPFVDDRIAWRLLSGGKYEMQRYGDDTCVAHNGKGVILTVTRMPGMSMEATAAYRNDGCNWSAAPGLAGAQLSTRCKEGNPRAQIHVGLGADTLNYTLVPGHEPTASEVAILQELAGKARAEN